MAAIWTEGEEFGDRVVGAVAMPCDGVDVVTGLTHLQVDPDGKQIKFWVTARSGNDGYIRIRVFIFYQGSHDAAQVPLPPYPKSEYNPRAPY